MRDVLIVLNAVLFAFSVFVHTFFFLINESWICSLEKFFFRVFIFVWLLKVYGTQLMIYADLNALLTLTVYFFSITFHFIYRFVWVMFDYIACVIKTLKKLQYWKKRLEKLFFSDASTRFTYGRYFLWFRMAFELIENILSYFQISFRCSVCSLSQSQTKHYAVKMTFILKHHFFLSTQCFSFQTRRLFKRQIFW